MIEVWSNVKYLNEQKNRQKLFISWNLGSKMGTIEDDHNVTMIVFADSSVLSWGYGFPSLFPSDQLGSFVGFLRSSCWFQFQST